MKLFTCVIGNHKCIAGQVPSHLRDSSKPAVFPLGYYAKFTLAQYNIIATTKPVVSRKDTIARAYLPRDHSP